MRTRRLLATIGIAAVIAAAIVAPHIAVVEPAAAAQNPVQCQNTLALTNGSFEQPVQPNATIRQNPAAAVPGWSTTDVAGSIEMWSNGFNPGNRTFFAESGRQMAELNAFSASTLYQDLPTTPGQTLGWSLAHRGRLGVDTMAVFIGPPNDSQLVQSGPNLSDGNDAWGTHTGTYVVPAGQTTTRFAFRAISSAGGSQAAGNLLDSITFGTGPCVVATKTVQNVSGNTPVRVGDTLRYVVSATNNGGNPALLAVANDVLPSGVTYVPGSMRITAGPGAGSLTDQAVDDRGEYRAGDRTVAVRLGDGATGSAGGTIDPGVTTTATFDVIVGRDAAGTTVGNTATVDYADPILGGQRTSTTQTTTTAIAPAADLAIAKTLDTTPIVAGQPVSYSLTASNSGPQMATGVRVTDALPSGLTDAVATGGDCTVTGARIDCVVSDLAVGGTSTITVTGTVRADADPGSGLANTAAVTGALTDPDRRNNVATASGTVTTSADLSMAKTFAPSAPVAGDVVTYTLAALNSGPSEARDVTITDPLDPGVSFISASIPGGTCSLVAQVMTCDVGTLAAGATVAATVVVRLAADANVVQNTATVTSSTPESDPSDNASSTSFAADAEADVRITKAATPAGATAGEAVTYTLHAINDGPSDAQNVVLEDTLPAGISVTGIAAPPGATCIQRDGGVRCQWEALPPGADEIVTVSATVDPDAPVGSLTNTATIASPTPDADTTNNAASTDTTVDQIADVSVAKTADPATAIAGSAVAFTVTATNSGPSVARAVVVTDAIPATISEPETSTEGCAIGDGVLACAIGDLAPGESASVSLTGTVPPGGVGRDIVNSASVTTAVTDPDAANDTATVTVPVIASADVSITKTAATATVRQGRPVQYTVTARNDGPSSAQGVTVQESPGAGLTITDAVASAGAWSAATLVWNVGDLEPGEQEVLTVTATATSAGTLANAVTVASVTPDPDTADRTATATITATAVVPAAAAPDEGRASFNRTATVDVLANDTPSTGTTFDRTTVRIRDGGGSAVSALEVPGQGRWSVDAVTGAVTFTPVVGFVGDVTAPYQVTDADGVTATSTVTVTIAGPPNVVDDSATTDQGDAVTIGVLVNDVGDGVALDAASVRCVDPETGSLVTTLTVAGEGTYSVDQNGVVLFTPVPSFSGTATAVTYSVADENGDRATGDIAVAVVPAADPVGIDDEIDAAYNTAVTFSPTANDDSGDLGTVFVPASVRLLDPQSGETVLGVTVAGEGVYTVDPATGAVTFAPDPDFAGAATPVSYIAETSFGGTATADITVTVARPGAPSATDDSGYAPSGDPIVLSPLANDTSGPAGTYFPSNTLRVVDPDSGDPVTSLIVPGEGVWAVDTATGEVTFTPEPTFSGDATPVDYAAETNVGDPVRGTITASIGTPPTAQPDSATVPSGRTATVDVLGNDVPGGTAVLDAATVRLRDSAGTAVATLEIPGTGTWSTTPTGDIVFVPAAGFSGVVTAAYQVTDTDGNVAVSTVTVTVVEPPVAVPDTASTRQGAPLTIDPLANDAPSITGAALVRDSLRLIDPATGDPVMTVSIPGQGVWEITDDGLVTFTPTPSFSGTADPIRYRVSDTDGVVVVSTIKVAVLPAPGVTPSPGGGLIVTLPDGGRLAVTGGAIRWTAALTGILMLAAGFVMTVTRRRPARLGKG